MPGLTPPVCSEPTTESDLESSAAADWGAAFWRTFLEQPGVTLVAVCDVYTPFRERAAHMCKEKVAAYKDFRQVRIIGTL